MSQWLQDFASRIDMPWWLFALAGITALVLAIVTVSFQSIKAALANPIETLRRE
jgi:putative ABC transport system permease protein